MISAKKIILGLLTLLVAGTVWFYYRWRQEDFMPSKENIVTIDFGNTTKPVFLRTKVWGVSGNHEEIILSESNKPIADKTSDYIFYTSEVYYRTEGNGTITLYAPESSISEPINKFSNTTVKIKGLNSTEEMQDYEANYEKYGLKKISVYN
jgi:hypothetical protein